MRNRASSQGNKTALPETAERGLRFYSLAAAAASVSALALALPAEGEIIITNKTIPIHVNKSVLLDFNGDGINDFKFFLSNYNFGTTSVNNLFVSQAHPPSFGDNVIGSAYSASALLRGAKIGPSDRFIRTYGHYGIPIEESSLCTQNCNGKTGYSFVQRLGGKWGGGHPNRFIGVKFQIKGQTHYGWIRLTVTIKHKGNGHGPTGSFSATITEYGYETVANKSCGAGLPGAAIHSPVPTRVRQKPASIPKTGPALGMLAQGADALPLWRRDD